MLGGRLADLSETARVRLFDRGRATDPGVERAVRGVIEEVRARGDDALRELAQRFDGATLVALEVPSSVCAAALGGLDPAVRAALEQAAAAIAAFHRAQVPAPFEIETEPGVRLGRRADPLRRVGVYAPGGRAAYPSSVLMGVVPARVAGVAEVVVCSPPGADGLPPAAVLAACTIAGADRVFALGGAGAVTALALGTASVPRVDKIVGPGNAYVSEAKRQLTGVVAMDSPAGPSEVLILADATADPTLVAVELIAQAEHDPDAAAVLVSTDAALCRAVAAALAPLIAAQPRAAIIEASLAARGALLIADDLDEAVSFAETYAPEHLLVMTAAPRALLPSLRAAGTIFLGAPSSVAFGDYITGANHVLPTAGLARAYAGLSTADFLRWTTYQEVSPTAAARLAAPTMTLATAEGLPAHALAARMRQDPAGPDRAPAAAPPALRPAYAGLRLYDPGRDPCAVDLSDNTNLFGAAPSVRALVAALPAPLLTRYPSVYARELKEALARRFGIGSEHITTGCGSDDVIDSALRAFCEPGDVFAYPDPTFSMVALFARMNAVVPRAVATAPSFQLDVDALLGTGARVIYICSPNNPTGTALERAAVLRLLARAPGIVLIDEAYAEFGTDDFVRDALASDRAIVLRTLSKVYGLAGLRIGFAIGPAHLIAEIEKSRGPYKVNAVAEAAACAVLSRDAHWIAENVERVRENRERLAAELRRRGAAVLPSAANFLLVPVAAASGGAQEWHRRLRARGVAIRPFPDLPHAGDAIRVSIGPWPMLERFLAAFDETTMELQP